MGVPEAEQRLGLGFYLTVGPGVGGRLKGAPEDFQVNEISAYPYPDPQGPFTVLRVRSQGIEQHELAERLARAVGVGSRTVRWAGTKDRRAVAERLFSYLGPPPESPASIAIPGAEVVEAYRAHEGLRLGHHYGNAFRLRISGLADDLASAAPRAETIRAELRSRGGFPNFFGPQRFGEVRPVTHAVGRLLVAGDTEAAVDAYLTWVAPGEEGSASEARRRFAEHRDPRRALAEFPPAFRFERQMLDHLARGHPPARAMRALSRELRGLFVHAFQSLLFNRYLTARWVAGLPLQVPLPGDAVLRVARDGTVPGTEPVPVGPDNEAECRQLVERGRALVAGPLVGFDTQLGEGPGPDLVRRLLDEEGIAPGDFRLPAFPELASAGSWRPLWTPLPPLDIAPEREGSGGSLRFSFALPKGCYATVLLREFMKGAPAATVRDGDRPRPAVPSNSA